MNTTAAPSPGQPPFRVFTVGRNGMPNNNVLKVPAGFPRAAA
jgi:hypothetical protein